MNILLIGSGAVCSALARKISHIPNIGEIYVAPGNGVNSDFYENVDIREDDATGLLRFVIENDVNLTIPLSRQAFLSDIVAFFQANGQNIFAPAKKICEILYNRIEKKKFLYRVYSQCPRFAVFNKFQNAYDYLKTADYPVIISSAAATDLYNDQFICPTINIAGKFLDDLYNKGVCDIVVENYMYGKNFTVYFITDGYTILPLNSLFPYKFDEKGFISSGVGCVSPNLYLSNNMMSEVLKIGENIIKSFEKRGTPYIGIVGLGGILCDDKIYINDIKPFFEDYDAAAILNSCEENMLDVFISCVNGCFSDDYEQLRVNDLYSMSLVVNGKYEGQPVSGFDNLDNTTLDFINMKSENGSYYSNIGRNFVLSCNASTVSRVRKCLKETIDNINFDGMTYYEQIVQEK